MSFYFIDKPIGYTSFDVVKILRGKLGISKIGHTGTLDPLATGGLLIATGRYTKLIPYFEKDTKEYIFSVNLDGKTDSYDLGTEVRYISKEEQKEAGEKITLDMIDQLIKEKYTGEIFQIPPKYSAIKVGGKKALDRVLDGESFDMKKRKCKVHNIEIISYKYPELSLKAKVSSGTYIRSLANDIGCDLGTGAYVKNLRRTKIGELDINEAQNLDTFDSKNKLSEKELFSNHEFIKLDETVLEKINNGIQVSGKFDFKENEGLFVFNGDKITNVVEYNSGLLIPRKKL